MSGSSTRRDKQRKPATDRTYTHPDVFTLGVTQGWAEAETDPTRINWAERQARADIPFEVINGRPVNPREKTGITRGRNEMGFWGEQKMADALVTVTVPHRLARHLPRWLARYPPRRGTRYLLMIERTDGYGWAVPGGAVEPCETGMQAALREMSEETQIQLSLIAADAITALAARYVPDPRASDEAWAVTLPVWIDLGTLDTLPAVHGADDARRAAWIPAGRYGHLTDALRTRFSGKVFAAHTEMLSEFLETGGERDGETEHDHAC